MRFTETALAGAFLIDLQPHSDERGWFARIFCEDEFAAAGLKTRFPQMNISSNLQRGTVRGMHYQAAPHEEVKIVRCVRGSIVDAIIDLRPASPTYRKSIAAELSDKNHQALYIPYGFAHGFQTLEDDTEVLYMMGDPYVPDAARGVRWNDPAFDVTWPLPVAMISGRDAAYPDYAP
jgi:dTDP-4-dehydrorhamnose 3,5-epimerase